MHALFIHSISIFSGVRHLMECWYLPHMREANVQTSLHIRVDPSELAYKMYDSS